MRRNPNVEAELYANREWDADRRDDRIHAEQTGEHCQKLVITPAWKGPCLPLRIVNDERHAVCPWCGAGWWSEGLLAFFPGMIEERLEEECDLYLHECEEEMT